MEKLAAYQNILDAAQGWGPGRAACRLVIGPNQRRDSEKEAHLIRLTADTCDLIFTEIEDPENTPDQFRILVILNGRRDQLVEFAGIMISVQTPSAR
jgi:hypothetical protein